MAETHQLREQKQQHFLLVVYPVQSHINPSLQLAKSLTRFLGVRVTFSTAVSGHRRMFPDRPTSLPVHDPSDPLLSFYPHSDGYDDGYDATDTNFMSTFKTVGSETLHALATAPGRPPVTCILYALLFPWVVDVATRLGVPSVLYWIQSAGTFVTYHHYFHSQRERFRSVANDPSLVLELPGLPSLRRQDLPSFFVGGGLADDTTKEVLISLFKGTFEALEKGTAGDEKPRVIVNTFGALERDAIEGMYEEVELIPIGPVLPAVCVGRSDRKETTVFGREVVKEAVVLEGDAKDEYLGWLDRWAERSVVYMSFGSITVLGREQRKEFASAIVESGRPFLWVVREDRDGVEEAEGVERGRVVRWCNQGEVLAHKAVGCFVTHHGWNSTLEAICCGVPMVGLPQWSDQPTNSRFVEGLWRVGVRAEVNGEGVVKGTELKRCLEAVMGDGEEAVEIRRLAEMWKEKAREAAKDGGPSDQNLKAFVEGIQCVGV